MNRHEARRLLGQLFALRLPGRPDMLDLERFPVANYIVFATELGPTYNDARRWLECWRAEFKRSNIRPLFMMDEEGGRVSQISGFFPSAPSPRAVSETLTPQRARTLYSGVSAALADLGIDVNLFPCLDINTEPLNPIIGTRSFGSSADRVTAFGMAAISGTRAHTACVAKHFPGHGMTREDSHLGLPVVNTSAEVLRSVHLVPFLKAAEAGTDGIMISHCSYRWLQNDQLPASLSFQIVNKLLRSQLGYSGMVITDSLDMDAITAHYDPRHACMLALQAGCDLLLFTDRSDSFRRPFEMLAGELASGRLREVDLRVCAGRRMCLLDDLERRRSPAERAAGDRYLELRDEVISGAARLIKGRNLLPLPSGEIALATSSDDIAARMGKRGRVGLVPLGRDLSPAVPLVLWLTEPLRLDRSIEDLKTLVTRASKSVLVTTYEALVDALPDCDVVITASDSGLETERRLLDLLFGIGPK